MAILLNPSEARVLGSLVEKETTTPEYYPLSINALVNACNQKNNRDPVMQLGENDVREALLGLEANHLAGPSRGSEGRVAKFEHRLQEVFNFTRGETAVFCVLLLRGPQTPGELRGRTERIYRFAEIEDVLAVLQRLTQRQDPLVTALPRQAGTKEVRYAHLLSGEPGAVEMSGTSAQENDPVDLRLRQLEAEVSSLRQEIVGLKLQLAELLATPS